MQNIRRCRDVTCWVSIHSTFSLVFWTSLLLSVSRCKHELWSWRHNSRNLMIVWPYGTWTPPCLLWFAGTVLLFHSVVKSLALRFGVQFWIPPWTPSVHWIGTHCLNLFGCIWVSICVMLCPPFIGFECSKLFTFIFKQEHHPILGMTVKVSCHVCVSVDTSTWHFV